MTRGEWYAQKNGGGWRKARKPRRCDRVASLGRCGNATQAGDQYFDTNTNNPNHPSGRATMGLCKQCASEELK